jgi:hypothetical protein
MLCKCIITQKKGNKMHYIALQEYLRIEKCISADLKLDIKNNLVLTNIKLGNKEQEHYVRVNAYLIVDKTWIKLARKSMQKYGLFTMIETANKPKLKTHTKLTNKVLFVSNC